MAGEIVDCLFVRVGFDDDADPDVDADPDDAAAVVFVLTFCIYLLLCVDREVGTVTG